MEINEIVNWLKEGNNRFISGTLEKKIKNSTLRELLAGGQSPFAVILGCADSRVVPEIVFDTNLGELFTVRVAGNVANIASLASIEYAVTILKVKVILVQGHSSCGAVSAAIEGGDMGYNLNMLFTHITPAIEQSPGGNIDEVVKKNAIINAEELVNRSPMIAEAVKSGQIKIFPTFYHLESGEVEFLTD